MVLMNKLKNGVGKDTDFALFMPNNVDILMKSGEFKLADEEIAEKLKQGNLKLIYRPNIYTIRRDQKSGSIILTDISTQKVECPTCLAAYKPGKNCSEILFHGFMLCLDKGLGKLTEQEQCEVKKITAHFEKLITSNMAESARHELKHIENDLYFKEAHHDNLSLNHEYYIRTRFLDEISATAKENIEQHVQTKEQGIGYIQKTFSEWMNNPQRESYYGRFGDFEHQYSAYEEENLERDTSQSEKLYRQILGKFFTFNINGQDMDLSEAIAPDFSLPRQSMQNLLNAQKLISENSRR